MPCSASGSSVGQHRPQALEGRLLRLGHAREVVVHVLVRHVGHLSRHPAVCRSGARRRLAADRASTTAWSSRSRPGRPLEPAHLLQADGREVGGHGIRGVEVPLEDDLEAERAVRRRHVAHALPAWVATSTYPRGAAPAPPPRTRRPPRRRVWMMLYQSSTPANTASARGSVSEPTSKGSPGGPPGHRDHPGREVDPLDEAAAGSEVGTHPARPAPGVEHPRVGPAVTGREGVDHRQVGRVSARVSGRRAA